MAPLDLARRFECSDVDRFADAYVDGEFAAPERALIEDHLEGCAGCRGELGRIMGLRTLLRARVGAGPGAPLGLREKIRSRLDEAERQGRTGFDLAGFEDLFGPVSPEPRSGTGRGGGRGFVQGFDWRAAFWPVLAGAAGAGALSLVYSLFVPQRADRWMVGDAAAMHARALPLEIATPQIDQLMPLFQHHLGFQVNLPTFPVNHVALQGGRLSHLGALDAAYLRYDDRNHGGRLSLFVLDDPGLTVRIAIGVPRVLPGSHREVYVSHALGRNVVIWRSQDIVYSLVSDLGEDETLALLDSTR